jgi:hypothetical protein
MTDRFDFIIGLVLGILLGGLGTYAMVRIKGWFTPPEVRRLRKEKRQLEKRIEQKDKYVDEMIHRAEDMAREMQKERTESHGT